MAIRNATNEDYAALSALHQACFGPRGERVWAADEWADMLSNPTSHCLVIDEGADILAALLLQTAGDEADVVTIMTNPAKQQAGHARTLLEDGIRRLSQLGIRRLLLEVAEDNHAARSLYTSTGFMTVGSRPGYYKRADGDAVDALILANDF